MTKLRDYQREAKAAVGADYRKGLRRVGVSLPTGTGKTVIFSDIARETYENGRRVVVLVHRDVLVEQAYKKLTQVIPESAVGIVKAAKNQTGAPVIVASIQTLANPNRLCQITPPALTIVDEAHVSVSPSYHAYYQHVGAVPGGLGYLCGFSATWMRGDRVGLGDIWEKVSFKRSIKWAVRHGHIVRPEGIQYGSSVDLSGVRTVLDPESEHYGDYNERDLQEVVMVDDLRDAVIKGYLELCPGEPAALFAPTQASAEYFIQGFNDAGVPAAEILARTTKASRTWNFASFDAGLTNVLGTCTALAVGWDSPRCSVALMVRPTRSQLLFIQTVGRILRPWPGKRRGLVVDYVGVLDDKSMASTIDLSTTPDRSDPDFPCPECGRGLCAVCTGCTSMRCGYFTCTCEQELDEYERVPIPRTAKKIEGVHEVDMFAGTDCRWLMTNRNIPFVQTKEYTYFIAPHEGEYAVGRCGARSIKGGTWLVKGLTSDDALEQGSELALAEDPSIANKKASWRTGKQPASPEQITLARRYGIDPAGYDKAELSDQISIKIASGLLAGIGAQ